jgi:hypothetical protein
MSDEACENTDVELWRETLDDYYSNSIHRTKSGSIGINVGGTVHVMPLEKWHSLAGGKYKMTDPKKLPWNRKPGGSYIPASPSAGFESAGFVGGNPYYEVPESHAEAFRDLCESCFKAHESGSVVDGEAALFLGKTLWRELFEAEK